jgi:hypothetical protein
LAVQEANSQTSHNLWDGTNFVKTNGCAMRPVSSACDCFKENLLIDAILASSETLSAFYCKERGFINSDVFS